MIHFALLKGRLGKLKNSKGRNRGSIPLLRLGMVLMVLAVQQAALVNLSRAVGSPG